LPRELPELPESHRPATNNDFGIKRGKKVIGGMALDDDSLVDKRMTKIASTIDKLNRQLQRFQEELHNRQFDPLMAGPPESQSSVYKKGGVALEDDDSNMSSCPEDFELLEVISSHK
jgi:hypothetical protein